MERLATWILPIAFVLVAGTPLYSAEPDKRQAAAIVTIEKVGGTVTVDKNKAVVGVGLFHRPITDADLQHLKGLNRLRGLILDNTNVTDAGLEHLKGLNRLRYLGLSGTQVTESGIQNLQKAIPDCQIRH